MSRVLAGEYAGLEEVDDRERDLNVGRTKLRRFRERLNHIEDAEGKLSLKGARV